MSWDKPIDASGTVAAWGWESMLLALGTHTPGNQPPTPFLEGQHKQARNCIQIQQQGSPYADKTSMKYIYEERLETRDESSPEQWQLLQKHSLLVWLVYYQDSALDDQRFQK